MSDPLDDVTQARLDRLWAAESSRQAEGGIVPRFTGNIGDGGTPEMVIRALSPWDLPATYTLTKPTVTLTINTDTLNTIMRTKRTPPLKRRWKRTYPKLGR